jgi:methyl-accepting chemotaxis protein
MKLTIMAILVGLLPMIIVGAWSYSTASRELEKSILQTNTVFSAVTKSKLNTFFEERLGDGKVLASSESVTRSMEDINNPDSTADQLERANELMGKYLTVALNEYGYTEVFITNNTGTVVSALEYKDSLLNADLSASDYVQGALNGQQTWSSLFYSDFTESNMMVLATPIYNMDQTDILGTINILFNQVLLNETIHEGIDKIGESGDSYLVDETGLLLTHIFRKLY